MVLVSSLPHSSFRYNVYNLSPLANDVICQFGLVCWLIECVVGSDQFNSLETTFSHMVFQDVVACSLFCKLLWHGLCMLPLQCRASLGPFKHQRLCFDVLGRFEHAFGIQNNLVIFLIQYLDLMQSLDLYDFMLSVFLTTILKFQYLLRSYTFHLLVATFYKSYNFSPSRCNSY